MSLPKTIRKNFELIFDELDQSGDLGINLEEFIDLQKSAAIQYGIGAATGFLSQKNAGEGDLLVKDQLFIKATSELGNTFVVAGFDGILGLAFKEISIENVVPLWNNMGDHDLIEDPIFSLSLDRNSDGDGGKIVFGGSHQKHYIGQDTCLKQFDIGEVLIGGKRTRYGSGGGTSDFGTSLIAITTSIIIDIRMKQLHTKLRQKIELDAKGIKYVFLDISLDKDVVGLQLLKDGEWFEVPIILHSLLVFLGDEVELLSNGALKSPVNRVATTNSWERVSLVMFYSIDKDKYIEPADKLVD